MSFYPGRAKWNHASPSTAASSWWKKREGGEWESVKTFDSNVDAERYEAETKLSADNPDLSKKEVKDRVAIDAGAAAERSELAKGHARDNKVGEG